MPTKTWTGAGANELWNTAANWSGGTIPVTGDDIVFDGVAANGKKNCTLNVGFTALSVTFTAGYSNTGVSPFNGTFTFGNNLVIGAGGLTLGINSTYATNATPTSYSITFNATCTFTANGKILPTNVLLGASGTTLTINGNADFGGNLIQQNTGHTIKSAVGVPCDLKIGGNIILGAMTTNVTDHVTIKGYGGTLVSPKTFGSNSASFNARVSFISGSFYTSIGNSALSGASFLTVEPGGQFNANAAHTFNNNNTTTVSGFNALNSSDFFAYVIGTLVLSTDTVIKSFIQIQSTTITITSSGASKLLLEGNLTSTGVATTIIDRLEFSGTTASNVTATTGTNLQIKELIINKTGVGSVNFNSNGVFALHNTSLTPYSWTHTSGTITQSSICQIRFSAVNTTGQFNYSSSVPSPFTFRYIEISGGTFSINTQLVATTLRIVTSTTTTTITSASTFGFTVEELILLNTSGALRAITLKSGVTYTMISNFISVVVGGTSGAIALQASAAPTKAIFNLEPGAVQNVEYVNPTNIDSSGTGGVLPFTKLPIYTFGGTITTTFNWNIGNQPPPVAAKVTVGYTFVN
jgi:hypothetical protein